MSDIKKKIEDEMKNKKIVMKPKSYFFTISSLYIFSIVIAILFALFLASFIFFATRSSGTNYFLDFGVLGILPYLASLPWLLIVVLIISIILVELFSTKIDLVSKKPLIYSFVVLIIIVIGAGIGFANTNLHNSFFERALERKIPIAEGFYKKYGAFQKENLTIAKIVKVSEKSILVESEGERYEINLSKDIFIPPNLDFFVDQEILIFGSLKDEIKGIKPLRGPKPKYKGNNIYHRDIPIYPTFNSI